MPTLSGLDEAYRLIKPQMEALDALLEQMLRHAEPCVAEMLVYATKYSGKKLRPALIFIIGDICGAVTEDHVKLGAVVEMIHLATLVHDDVVDNAAMRRYTASVNVRWSNKDAVLLGDIIFARAINLLASIRNYRALDLLTQSVSTICEGEIHQNQLAHDASLDEATYLKIIRNKTASLYSAGCELAALLSGVRGEVVEAFSHFGMSLGTAFQIIDDCLDISGEESVVGKSLGSDVTNGKVTLPIIHLLMRLEGARRMQVCEMIRTGRRDASLNLRDLLLEHDSLGFAMTRARRIIDEALARLRRLLDPQAYAVVDAIAGFVLSRQL
jgi:octaprenyl-diphosphate synthase